MKCNHFWRRTIIMADYFVGLDLGQVQDFTAIAIVGLDEKYLNASRALSDAYDRLDCARKQPWFDEIDERIARREIEEKLGPLPDPVYEVRYLERLPLRTPYTEVARRVKLLLDTPSLRGNAELVVDATGVGVAVIDLLKAEGLRFWSITITGGEKQTQDGSNCRVPKKDLVARTQVLLEEGNRRIKIAASLPEATTLVDELLNYRYNITDAGNEVYGTWREGQHDDLVFALCMAVWAAERRSPPVYATLVDTSYLPFPPLTEPPFPPLNGPLF
jgi:hypothetical protein